MNTLGGRLLLAFAGVIALGGLLTVQLVGRSASSEMRHVMMVGDGEMRMTDSETLRDTLAASYARNGGWSEAQSLLGDSARHMRMMGGAVALVAPDGEVLAGALPEDGAVNGATTYALPVMVDGRVVATLWLRELRHMASGSELETAVARVHQAAWQSALVAALVAFALAWVIVRTISRPLADLARTAHTVAAGDLSARAPLAGPAEVREVAASFNAMAASLAHQEALRRGLLSDVAHELRTPLAVLRAQAEALEDGILPPTPENLSPFVAQTDQLTRLVDDLGTLAVADAGHLTLDRATVSLAPLVSDLVAALAADAARRGVTLTHVIPADLPALDVDPVRLRQVLANLLTNALRHTPSGGAVTVSADLEGDTVRIAVADTGEGIAPEDLPRVFERFYRTDKSRSRATGGSGLGLAISRRLVEAHGGTVLVASELGQGTVVTVRMPSVAGAPAAAARPPATSR